jgi:hypothetical protein
VYLDVICEGIVRGSGILSIWPPGLQARSGEGDRKEARVINDGMRCRRMHSFLGLSLLLAVIRSENTSSSKRSRHSFSAAARSIRT